MHRCTASAAGGIEPAVVAGPATVRSRSRTVRDMGYLPRGCVRRDPRPPLPGTIVFNHPRIDERSPPYAERRAPPLRRRPDRPRPRRGVVDLVGHPAGARRDLRGVRRGAGRRGREERRRRVGAHRRGPDARPPGGGRGGRVRASWPGRSAARAADRLVDRDRARDRGGPAAAGRADQRRHPDAGGHAGVRADDPDQPGGRGPQGGRAAVPRLPPQPHDRRRDGVVGLARPRHRRRARRAGRVPRAAGLRGALRQGVPRGRADRREPLRARHHRRRPRARRDRRTSSTARWRSCWRRARASPRSRRPPTTRSPTSTPGTPSPGRAAATGPAYAGC